MPFPGNNVCYCLLHGRMNKLLVLTAQGRVHHIPNVPKTVVVLGGEPSLTYNLLSILALLVPVGNRREWPPPKWESIAVDSLGHIDLPG